MSGRVFKGAVFADYFQLFVRDLGDDALPNDCTDAAVARRVAAGPHALLVFTARNMTVPLRVEVHEARPAIDFAAVQHAVLAGFTASTGHLLVNGLMDDPATAGHLVVPPGPLGTLVLFFGLDTLDEAELEGDDHYAIHVWPAEVVPGLEVLKAYDLSGGG